MGRKCCIQNCKNNGGEGTSCFKFPSDDKMKNAWLQAIPKENIIVIKNSGICILHFDMKYIKSVKADGSFLERPRLTDDAVPSIFNFNYGIPQIFSFDAQFIHKKQQEFIQERKKDENLIYSFEDFKNRVASQIKSKYWQSTSTDFSVTLFKMKSENKGKLSIQCQLIINNELNVQIFNENNLLDYDFYKDLMPRHQSLNLFSELNSIIDRCDVCDGQCVDEKSLISKFLKNALRDISEVKDRMKDDFEFANCITLIHDQLLMLTKKKRRYDVKTILYAYMIYIQSSKTYTMIRESGILILPSIPTLSKITRYQNVDPNDSNSNISYLKKMVANLTEEEKYVVIQMDEIYTNSEVSYWHRLNGFAENVDEVATTVLGVMVSSCFGKMKEIVNLIPMKDGTGQDLTRYALNIIDSLQLIGQINQHMSMKSFCKIMTFNLKVWLYWHL